MFSLSLYAVLVFCSSSWYVTTKLKISTMQQVGAIPFFLSSARHAFSELLVPNSGALRGGFGGGRPRCSGVRGLKR